MSTTVYTCLSVNFTRVIEGDQLVPWAYPETQYTADPVLGSAGVSYLDIGGDSVATLEMVGSFSSAADRLTLINGRGSTVTLSNTRGHSDTVTIVKATPINSNPYSLYLAQLVFVLRP